MRPQASQDLNVRKRSSAEEDSLLSSCSFFNSTANRSLERPLCHAFISVLSAPGKSASSGTKDLVASTRTSEGFSPEPGGAAQCSRCAGNTKANVRENPAPTAVPPRSPQRHRTTIAHEQERAADISHIITATYIEIFMESAKSRAIFAALQSLVLECIRQCRGSNKCTERRLAHAKSAPGSAGGESGQANASKTAGWSGHENGRTRRHAPVRIIPNRLKRVAVAPPALVLNRTLSSIAVRVRAARLGVPVFVWIKHGSV